MLSCAHRQLPEVLRPLAVLRSAEAQKHCRSQQAPSPHAEHSKTLTLGFARRAKRVYFLRKRKIIFIDT